MILSKNELRSSSGIIRYRVRVSCSCPATVPLPCPTYVTVVPFVSPCLTIPLFACSMSAVLSPVRCPLFSVLCACSSCVVPMLFLCARVCCALFPRFSHALIRHGCCMQRYTGSCSYLDNCGLVLSVILMFSVCLWLLASEDCAVN
jgi:hypothetical protein